MNCGSGQRIVVMGSELWDETLIVMAINKLWFRAMGCDSG